MKIILLSIFFSLCSFSGNKSDFGGIQLLMTLEQQKKIERLVQYIEIDRDIASKKFDSKLSTLQIASSLEVKISDSDLQELLTICKRLEANIDELKLLFDKVYFTSKAEEGLQEYFKPMKTYFKVINDYITVHSRLNFASFIKINRSVSSNFDDLKQHVKDAKVTNEETIRQKIQELTVWEWLFGY